MDEQDILEHRYRFFSEKGLQVTAEQDRALVTIFTSIVAGLLALVVSGKVAFWSGVFFLIAGGMAVMGLAWCLVHMAFTSKVLFLLAAQFGGDENVPNVAEGEISTEHAVRKARVAAQGAYASQLIYLLLAVAFSALGLAAELWPYVKAIGLILGAGLIVLLVIGVWKGRRTVSLATIGAQSIEANEADG